MSRSRDKKCLAREMEGAEYRVLLQQMQEKVEVFRRFGAWQEVIAFLHEREDGAPEPDQILGAIIAANNQQRDSRWTTILLLALWPALEVIHRQKRMWARDPAERWHAIVGIFLRVVSRVDVEQRARRLATKLFNDVVHHLHDECQRAWKHSQRVVATDEDELEELAGTVEGPDLLAIEWAGGLDVQIGILRRFLNAGQIDKLEFEMLVKTRIGNEALSDFARRKGLDYQAAKKRRLRVEAVIGRSRIPRSAS